MVVESGHCFDNKCTVSIFNSKEEYFKSIEKTDWILTSLQEDFPEVYKELMDAVDPSASAIISVEYISVWDGDEIETNAKVDLETGEIVFIETVDISNEYNACEKEFIR
ncbi:hypothetical protein [Alkaliphilus sp. B6464]|uniref:hypothetical protein n=1 Tax=Alkaliphilus sp. B6464 TaxID=2731219 RepID=UPI001BA97A58|nr:hypothetical protein [Alkaliphilus sp. B6464]QUH22068.1 hypothetical protein HYG84_19370 [Alkaliphilus sp. B6464]